MKHTLGPWICSKEKNGQIEIRSLPTDYPITAISTEDLNPEEDRANARLIAAAPDLLEACRATFENSGPAGMAVAKQLAKEAIDKFEGRKK